MSVKSVAVYCGENPNMTENHALVASALGTILAEHGVKIIYGGTKQGLMGVVANAALAAGGEVVGVVTEATPVERRHSNLTEIHVVEDLDERKKLMSKLSESTVALPGGHGTFDELEREITLVKFGKKNGEEIDRKIAVLDPDNFFYHYNKQVEKMGKIKGNDTDSKLFSLVKNDIYDVLNKIGVISDEKRQELYRHFEGHSQCAQYSSRYYLNKFLKPITDTQRLSDLFRSKAEMAVGLTAMSAPIVAPALFGTISAPQDVYSLMGLAFAGIATAVHGVAEYHAAKVRPIHNPGTANNPVLSIAI